MWVLSKWCFLLVTGHFEADFTRQTTAEATWCMQILLQIGKDLCELCELSGYLLGFGKARACSGCGDVGRHAECRWEWLEESPYQTYSRPLGLSKIEASDLVSNLNVIESLELSSAQVRRLLPPPCLPPAPQPPLPVPPPFPPPAPHDQGTGRILKLSQLNKQMQKHQREKRHKDNKNGMKSRLTKSCHPAEVLAVSAQLKNRMSARSANWSKASRRTRSFWRQQLEVPSTIIPAWRRSSSWLVLAVVMSLRLRNALLEQGKAYSNCLSL